MEGMSPCSNCHVDPEVREFRSGKILLYMVRCPICHKTGEKSLSEGRAVKKWNKERGGKSGGNRCQYVLGSGENPDV